MNPRLKIEFCINGEGGVIVEESLTFPSPDDFLDFISPGGGCESIDSAIDEVRVILAPGGQFETGNRLAAHGATLQVGMYLFTGPLAEIADLAQRLIAHAADNDIAESFYRMV
ncbi:MAG: hypothetical protein KDG50_15465 [Chromatiales bacterium]|nr:hypothetical protein [Chromatiales bacterium]